MDEHNHMATLLTFFDSLKGNLYLKLPFLPEKETLQRKSPFLILMDSNPLTYLLEAQFLNSDRSEPQRVFLLVQKDHYSLPKDNVWPINNRDVEDYWKKTFSFYVSEKKDCSLITLSHQINRDGKLSLLQSVFYCKIRHVFFYPPCPKCGRLLDQCYDDDLLTHSGLQPYSTSLKRYLFCSSCHREGRQDFYIYELEDYAPPFLKDRWSLMKEFGKLFVKGGSFDLFPCTECPQYQECYGSSLHVLSRMIPFSFYPFYMFIFDAMSLAASDFLTLLSGLSFEELETQLKAKGEFGRLICLKNTKRDVGVKATFFGNRDERLFLEILNLKLAFLGEIIQNLSPSIDFFEHPELWLSIDQIWIKLLDQSDRPPFFYNFKLKFIDIIWPLPETLSYPKLIEHKGLFSLGMIWFYTLLVNKKQNFSEVELPLKEALNQFSSDPNFSIERCFKNNSHATFLPENLFWNPEGKSVNQNFYSIWEKSLDMGWSLLKSSLPGFPRGSKEELWQGLENLRQEVKNKLFREPPVNGNKTIVLKTEEEDDEAIHRILLKILEKWQMKTELKKEHVKEKEAIPETVILLPPEGFSPSRDLPLKEVVSEEKVFLKEQISEGDFLTETVILGPNQDLDSSSPMKSTQKSISGERKIFQKELEQQKRHEHREKHPLGEDVLPETVILGTDKARDRNER